MAVKLKRMNEEDNKTQSKQPGESSLYQLSKLVNVLKKRNISITIYNIIYDIVTYFMMS